MIIFDLIIFDLIIFDRQKSLKLHARIGRKVGDSLYLIY